MNFCSQLWAIEGPKIQQAMSHHKVLWKEWWRNSNFEMKPDHPRGCWIKRWSFPRPSWNALFLVHSTFKYFWDFPWGNISYLHSDCWLQQSWSSTKKTNTDSFDSTQWGSFRIDEVQALKEAVSLHWWGLFAAISNYFYSLFLFWLQATSAFAWY